MNPTTWLLVLLPALLGPAGPGSARVLLVELDVAVTDAAGWPVAGLPAERFAVLEDGVSQPLARFQEVDASAMTVVLDNSASMERWFWSARAAAWDLLRAPDSAGRTAVLACGNGPGRAGGGNARDSVEEVLSAVRLEDREGSALIPCLAQAVALLDAMGPGSGGAVVLLSDGRDTTVSDSEREGAAEDLARRFTRRGTRLHALLYEEQPWLERLSRATGGTSRSPREPVAGLSRLLGHHYELGYYPATPVKGWHPLRVDVSGDGLHVDAPSGYHLSRRPTASD